MQSYLIRKFLIGEQRRRSWRLRKGQLAKYASKYHQKAIPFIFSFPISKVYTTENAYRSHLLSKRHKETELKVVIKSSISNPSDSAATNVTAPATNAPIPEETKIRPQALSLAVNGDAMEDEENQTIDEKIAAARSRLSINGCLFCLQENTSLEENLNHMSSIHSFFIPDADYLFDITGLISYLGEKIAVGNVCIYCNGKGRELKTLEAVRKHMVDKSHCKIAYESEEEKLEISDYYDFTSSYPNPHTRQERTRLNDHNDETWEDVDDPDGEVDEVIDVDLSEDESATCSDDSLPNNQITYGDSPLELVLPSGARIGHRTMRRYYAQSFSGTRGGRVEDPNSGSALVRRLLADKNSALVPRKGGYGAFGTGTEVVKARNRGEAREAGRHIREFRDQKRREDFKTKVGFVHNSQKHFRDPRKQCTTCLTTTLADLVHNFVQSFK